MRSLNSLCALIFDYLHHIIQYWILYLDSECTEKKLYRSELNVAIDSKSDLCWVRVDSVNQLIGHLNAQTTVTVIIELNTNHRVKRRPVWRTVHNIHRFLWRRFEHMTLNEPERQKWERPTSSRWNVKQNLGLHQIKKKKKKSEHFDSSGCSLAKIIFASTVPLHGTHCVEKKVTCVGLVTSCLSAFP